MDIYPEFPAHRLADPQRRGELAVYRALEASDANGIALYEARPPGCREVDFAIWLLDCARISARISMEVKAGAYRIVRGRWHLDGPNGEQKVSTPARQTWDAAMKLHDFLDEGVHDGRNPCILPVLLFCDMEPDPDIQAWAEQAWVYVRFGMERMVENLVALAADAPVHHPPTAEEIAQEVNLVMPGVLDPPPEADGPVPDPTVLQARQVIIQHAEVVNVHTTGAELPD